MLRLLLLVLTLTLHVLIIHSIQLHAVGSMNEYSFWKNSSVVGSPELFSIDEEHEVIVLAVKNSLCHISLDLTETINVIDTTPLQDNINHCMLDSNFLQPEENCQNFHHVLVFPDNNDTILNNENVVIDVRETVLVCGSNAFQPKCIYRNRTDLNPIKTYSGDQFCPPGADSTTHAVVTADGQLVSGSPKDLFSNKYGISVSFNPFNGTTQVRTINNPNMFKDPTFIDIYEIGEYYYIFMTERAVEITDDIIYSRVGRICRNDTGIFDTGLNQNLFTSFLKARLTCTSEITDEAPTYYYNNLKDTQYVDGGEVNAMVTGRHLYAAFSAPVNGPDGSVLCVYTFDGDDNDLNGIFKQEYLEEMGTNNWVRVSNDDPVTCSEQRDLKTAENLYLMKPAVVQVGEPLIKLDGLLFQRIIIDKVTGINGKVYEVVLIGANEEDFFRVLKMTYVSTRNDEDKTHISQATKIASEGNDQETVTSMELYKTEDEATLYLSTTGGLYRVPITDCSKYTDCRSCVESRDPYCAFDKVSSTCVNTLSVSNDTMNYVQDIDNGVSTGCPVLPSSTSPPPSMMKTTSTSMHLESSSSSPTPSSTTTECTETVKVTTVTVTRIVTATSQDVSTSVRHSPTTSTSTIPRQTSSTVQTIPLITSTIEPTIRAGALKENQSNNHLYMMIGIGIACLLIGIAFGVVAFACLRNKDKFIWGKMLSRNRRLNFDDDDEKCNGGGMYEMHPSKGDEYEKNNAFDFAKDSTPRPSTPPLTKLNPTIVPGRVTDSPVLSKYTTTGKSHSRSLSSGGQFPINFSSMEPPARHSPMPESPTHKNIRNTFHVEEGISNLDRQRFGKNVVSKQLSREYPMTINDSYHAKTNSLDLDGWKAPR